MASSTPMAAALARVHCSATGAVSAVEWKLSEIRDRSGNKVKFTWKSSDGTTYGTTHPEYIDVTQTSSGSGSYVYRMDFNYSAGGNAAASTPYRYVGLYPVTDSDLLTSITVSDSSTVKRKYVLTYGSSSSTGAKRLTGVTECSDSGATDCLSPTTISYQDNTPGVNLGSPWTVSGSIGAADGSYDVKRGWHQGHPLLPLRHLVRADGLQVERLWHGFQHRHHRPHPACRPAGGEPRRSIAWDV